jgi:hypothetical protein
MQIAIQRTRTGDTAKLVHLADTAALFLYPVGARDSGYYNGTNFWGDRAFAERYTFNGHDSSVTIIGLFAQFGGSANASSSKTINFHIWDQGDQQVITSAEAYNGFPNNVLYTKQVPVTQLGLGPVADTLKKHLFTSPVKRYGSFFVGYSMDYNFASLNGDTIALASTRNGSRKSQDVNFVTANINEAGDTTLTTYTNVENATLYADSIWHDNATQYNGLSNYLAIYPIVVIGNPTGVNSISRNGLSLFGTYPNPAINSTNLKFGLATTSDVTIQIMSMDGRTVKAITENDLQAGEHIIKIATSDMAAGSYLYLVRTAVGDGIAGTMTVQ